MWNLIRMEIKKVPLKPHIAGLLAANFIIFLLSVFTSSLLTASGNISTLPGFAPVQLDTVTLAAMLVRATLIVWEAVLISVFVIEEFRNKTIGLLFTYPISRTKLITAKLILICGIMFLFHVLSNIFQYATIFLAAKCFDFVTFSFGNIMAQAVTTISAHLTCEKLFKTKQNKNKNKQTKRHKTLQMCWCPSHQFASYRLINTLHHRKMVERHKERYCMIAFL